MLFRSVLLLPAPGGHAPVIPTATASRPRRGGAVPTGRPLCRAACVGALARRVLAHPGPGRVPGAACVGTRTCTHLGAGRTVWRCERLSRSGRMCVCLCPRSLVYGAHGGARWCAYGLSLWACGSEARCAVFGCLSGRVFVRPFTARFACR